MVLFSMILVGAVSWIWLNREWVKARLLADGEPLNPIQELR
jgi:hypothetical protein